LVVVAVTVVVVRWLVAVVMVVAVSGGGGWVVAAAVVVVAAAEVAQAGILPTSRLSGVKLMSSQVLVLVLALELLRRVLAE
jgi:hypothetical protein